MGTPDTQSDLDFTGYIANHAHDFSERAWVWRALNDWLADPAGPRCFLLTGAPGSGKTAIASRLVQFAQQLVRAPDALPYLTQDFLSAFFFCSAQDYRWIDPHECAGSLATQLANKYPPYLEKILELRGQQQPMRVEVKEVQQRAGIIESGGRMVGVSLSISVSGASPEYTFNQVVRRPLAVLCQQEPDRRVTILVDSLDEALLSTQRPNIVSLLARAADLPPGVRFIFTSRADAEVLRLLRAYRIKVCSLTAGEGLRHSLEDVRRHVIEVCTARPSLAAKLAPDLSLDDFAEAVQGKSDGNFLYVHYLLQMMETQQAKINQASLETLPDGLDGIYLSFLGRIVQDTKDWATQYSPVIGTLAVAQEELTEKQLADFVGRDQSEVRQSLQALSQFLKRDETLPASHRRYTIYHRSFADLLLHQDRAEEYWCEAEKQHRRLADYYWQMRRDDWRCCDRYGLLHVSTHLRLAKQDDKLFELVRNQAWYQAKITLEPSGNSYRADLTSAHAAAEALNIQETNQGSLARYLGQEVHCALAMTSLGSLSAGIPPALLKALVESKQWSINEAYDAAWQNPDPYKKTQALCAVVSLMPQEARHAVIQKGLHEAEKIDRPWSQAEAQLALAAQLPTVERQRVERQTLDFILGLQYENRKTDTLAWVAPSLPDHLLSEALKAILRFEDTYNREKALVALVPRLSADLLHAVLHDVVVEEMECQPAMMAAQACYLPEAESLALLRQSFEKTRLIEDEYWQDVALRALASSLPADLLSEAFYIARRHRFHNDSLIALAVRLAATGNVTGALHEVEDLQFGWQQVAAFAAISHHLSTSHLARAFEVARGVQEPYWQAEVLGLLALVFPDDAPPSVLEEALARRKIDDADQRARALAALAVYLPESFRRAAFAAAQQIKDDFSQVQALAMLAAHLPADLIGEALALADNMSGSQYEVQTIAALAPRLSVELQQQVLDDSASLRDERRRTLLLALIPCLSQSLLPQAFRAARRMRDDDERTTVLEALIPHLSETALRQALEDAREMQGEDTRHSARLLTAIAACLPESAQSPVWDEALQIFQQLPDYRLADPDVAALVKCLVKKARFAKALGWIGKIIDGERRANTLEEIIPLVPEDLLPHVRRHAEQIPDGPATVRVLARLGQRMPENPLHEVVTRVLHYSHTERNPEIAPWLVTRLPHLPDAMRLTALKRALEIMLEMHNLNDRSQALRALGTHLLADQTALPLDQLYELWRDTLQKITALSRSELLDHLNNLASVMAVLGGVEAVQESFRAVQEVGQWWP